MKYHTSESGLFNLEYLEKLLILNHSNIRPVRSANRILQIIDDLQDLGPENAGLLTPIRQLAVIPQVYIHNRSSCESKRPNGDKTFY
jgi:hypothetical protein